MDAVVERLAQVNGREFCPVCYSPWSEKGLCPDCELEMLLTNIYLTPSR
jgi:predicted amidophosphoribosyltransferase